MNRSLVFRLRARLDIVEAKAWYESRAEAGRHTGEDFVEDIETAAAVLQENPDLYQRVHGDVRRVVLRRFPYKLFYKIEPDKIVVLRCLHHSRNPSSWPLDED